MPCMCECLRRPEEGAESPGAGVISSCDCEPPDLGAGKLTNSKCS